MGNTVTSWRNRSPGDLSIELPEVHSDPTEPAIEAAVNASRGWAATPLGDRVAMFKQAQAAIEQDKQHLADGIALETGKPLREATGEIGAVIAKFDLTIDDAQRLLADDSPQNLHPAIVRRRPRGPAVVVGPFNFPIHLPHGQILAHLIAGNPVIFKPSPLAANVCARYGRVMAGIFPAGVFNLVQGGGEEGKALCTHPAVRSVAFTGSVPVGRQLATLLAGDLSKDVALELGGKNAAIVCADADLQKAADAIAEAACLTAGQRCNATSRVIVDRRVSDGLIERLRQSLKKFVPGDPLDEATNLGPLVSQAAVDRYERMTSAEADGQWIIPPAMPSSVNGKRGHYVNAALLHLPDGLAAEQPALFAEEAFAPIITLVAAADEAAMLALHDLTPFGLTASVFTRSRATFDRMADGLAVGNVYANLPTTFSPSTLPFGGLRDSGNGRPGGRGFVRFTTDEQVVQLGKDGFER
ncbi:MAG TPA: aldehyde dehydrogenase family protein [Tepidisphaeraceae bacterium]|jgi:acyl-CoA reductase-like NAD-dependent aldehyde dehydrogenase|nr:aldehyde dehydrogenase family protein [Tepidisphaeraceae bacterium]